MDLLHNRRVHASRALHINISGFTHIRTLQLSAINVFNGTWMGASFSYQALGGQRS